MDLDQRLARFFGKQPDLHPSSFVAQGAALVGDVTVGEEASVWYHVAMRGDINRILVGPRSNVQDGCVLHVADDYPAILGEYVTCGHKAVIHACTIGDEVLVGMGSIILDGVEVGARSIIGANALVTGGMKIPPGSLVLGSPAKVVKQLDRETQLSLKSWAEKYVQLSRRYLERRQAGEAL